MKNKLIHVGVDRRTELMGVMLLISDYPKKYPKLVSEMGNKEYRDEILSTFSKYKNHKTIRLLNKMIKTLCFNHDAPTYLIMQMNEDLSSYSLDDYPFKTRLGSSPIVLEFLDSLKSFSEKIGFDKFFDAHKAYYQTGINQIQKFVSNHKFVQFLQNFYNKDFENINFEINLMHFATRGNFGIHVKNNFICNQCLRPSKNGKPNFINNKADTATLYVHEFSHSVVNPATEKLCHILPKTFANIQSKMDKLCYNLTNTIVDEHIVRSIELVFLHEFFNEQTVKKYIDDYSSIGFIHIKNVYEKLLEYRANQQKYDSFEDFYPQILEVFEKGAATSNSTCKKCQKEI